MRLLVMLLVCVVGCAGDPCYDRHANEEIQRIEALEFSLDRMEEQIEKLKEKR